MIAKLPGSDIWDLSHAALAEQGGHFIDTETGTSGQGHERRARRRGRSYPRPC